MKLFYGEIYPNIHINEEEQQHIIKVLRMKDGDAIALTDGLGNIAKGILCIEGKKARIDDYEINQTEDYYSPKLHIAIAPTKNIDRIEFFVEKAVEMGISEITFILTDNSERKIINYDKIVKQAIAASKQSLRTYFPKINNVVKLSEFIDNCEQENTLVAHCNDNLQRTNIKEINNREKLTILIGPEGDFSDKEITKLADNNIQAITLGPQRLRTETAGVFIASWNYEKMV